MENILKIENIEKYYGSKSSLTKAIDNISFEVEKGEFVAIMGSSGSGKTTLLNCISTIDKVTAGHIFVGGTDITKLKGNSLNKFRREDLGFIFQDFNLLDTLTAYENIALALSIQNVSPKEIDKRIKKVARELDIESVLKKYPYQMSGGQKQRVAAARAIITDPCLILADEPTGALDSKSSKMLLEKLTYLNNNLGATILMVTHDAYAASYATRIIFIKDGKIYNEIRKGNDTRKEFFDKIIDVVTLLGGDIMMLFKLSIKNITKSIKDYAIYFFTLVLGVAIFYVFNAIDSQTVMLNVSSSTSEIIRLMTTILGGVSVFVSFILGFLIIYASRFLIKRRNKEFGIYLTLGMSKRKISLILFFETLIIGVISLGVGLALGIVLSQLMSILVANMFEADLTKFQFTFSSSAALKTLLYFSIMYLIVMIFNTIIVNKCKLIDLLHGNKKSEKVKLKNPIICTIVFIIAVIALSYAYYLVTDGFSSSPLMNTIRGILLPIALGCVSTFLIFWSLSGLILKIVMHLKKYYYKGLNSFTVRQISSKINTTVFSMTIICLMLFFTICIFSSALSIKNSLSGNLKDLAPVDIQFSKLQESLSKEEKENFSKDIIEDYNTTVKDTLQRLDVYKYLKEVVDINIYRVEEITLKDSFGDQIEQIGKDYPTLAYNVREDLVKLSDYNRLAKLYNKKELTLKDNEYVIISNYKMMADIRNISLKNNTKLTINGKDYYPKYQECQDGIIELSGSATNTGVIILPDNALESIPPYKNILAANYQAGTKEEKENVEDIVSTIINNHFNKDTLLSYNTKIDIYASSIGLGAMVTFVGLYLGIIFLISSAAILALKELSESTDNKERFNMLRKIGTDEKMINKALFNQIAVFFLFPLLLAIIHSIFGIEFANYILKTMGTESLLSSIILTAVFLVVIYGGYFLVTYYCSKTIIKER